MSTTPTTISIDGQDYVRADSVSKASGEVRIVILQRGWNVVGRYVEHHVRRYLAGAARPTPETPR